jgi:hypothetical protein
VLASAAASASTELSPYKTVSTVPISQPSTNGVASLLHYAKDSITRTVDGCQELWTNHGRCKDIRKKIAAHRETIKSEWVDQGILDDAHKQALKKLTAGISYEEFVFLQRGKEDRGKVLNLFFLMWGAPKFLPYALLFNPDMLPTPFRQTTIGSESVWAKQSRERSAAVLNALVNIEKAAMGGASTGLAKSLSFFTKKKQTETRAQMLDLFTATSSFLNNPTIVGKHGAKEVLNSLPAGWLTKQASSVDLENSLEATSSQHVPIDDFDRAAKRLANVPRPVIQGMANILAGGAGGFFAGIQPTFLTRGQIVGHIRKLEETDDFLVDANIDLQTINKRLLREACSDRFLGAPGMTEDELRQGLADWLDLVVMEPAAQLQSKEITYHNGNLCRFVVMAYNSLQSTRNERSTATLPRLLYSGSRNG